MMPECMLQNIAQPQRKPAAGEKRWRRKMYTPPVRGIAEESKAQTLAPNQVSAPAAIQTKSMPPKLGTARDTSDGCTKIDEPTIVPTTIAVACVNPIVRANLAVTPRIVSSAAPKIGSRIRSRIRSRIGSRIGSWIRSWIRAAGWRGSSPDRRRLTGGLLVDRLDRREGV